MSQKRIVMIVKNDITHDGRVRKEAHSAAEAGYEVVVIGVKTDSSDAEEVWEPAPGVSVRMRRVGTPMTGRGNAVSRRLRNFRDLSRMRRALAEAAIAEKPDLVHANDLDALPAGIAVGDALGCPVLYDAHELYAETFFARSNRLVEKAVVSLMKSYLTREERRLIVQADSVITVSPPRAEELCRRYDIAPPAIVLNAPIEMPIRELPLPDMARPLCLYQGGLQVGRGLIEMAQAFLLPGEGSLVVMGSGPLWDSLCAIADSPEARGRIKIVPPVPQADVVSAAASADIGLIPYMPTGLNNLLASPNKLFDYMHAGLAIVASDLPYLRTTLDETGAGVLVTPGDVHELATAIDRLAHNPAALDTMKRAAKAASPEFTWEQQSSVLIGEYRRLLDG